jgi:hypothetical protein
MEGKGLQQELPDWVGRKHSDFGLTLRRVAGGWAIFSIDADGFISRQTGIPNLCKFFLPSNSG